MRRRGRHCSPPPGLKPTLDWLEGLPQVKAALFGPYRPKRKGVPVGTLLVDREERGGLAVSGVAGDITLPLHVIPAPPADAAAVRRLIEARYPRKERVYA